jgi:hypothetical protein
MAPDNKISSGSEPGLYVQGKLSGLTERTIQLREPNERGERSFLRYRVVLEGDGETYRVDYATEDSARLAVHGAVLGAVIAVPVYIKVTNGKPYLNGIGDGTGLGSRVLEL